MKQKEIIRFAFIKSMPIMFSYLFMGAAYGILMIEAGFLWSYAVLISAAVYTGAFQFLFVSLLSNGVSFLTTAVSAFLINSRQLFYTLTFVDDFKKMGKKKLYMIQTLTDETYAVNCSLEQVDEEKRSIMFWVALLSHMYWILGTLVGSLIGKLIPFSTEGIDFCMTALFITIFMDQWRDAKDHFSALLGLAVALICLFLFGESRFILPTLLLVSAILVFRNARGEEENR